MAVVAVVGVVGGWCGAAAGHGRGRAEHYVLCQQSDVGMHSP